MPQIGDFLIKAVNILTKSATGEFCIFYIDVELRMKYVRVEGRPGSWIRRQKYGKPLCPFLSSMVRNYCESDTMRNFIDHVVFTTKEEHHNFCSAGHGMPHYSIYPTFEVTTPSFNKILIEAASILLFYSGHSDHGRKFGLAVPTRQGRECYARKTPAQSSV
jgi:hypothetical protein